MKRIIVAFGDSLTFGYQSPTASSPTPLVTPYTDILKRRLEDVLKERKTKVDFSVLNRGVCGDLTQGMLQRFLKDVLEYEPDFVIILGGSNDIGWVIPPREIFMNLEQMYNDAFRNKIEVITCTVPSISGYDLLIPPRIELNTAIKDYSLKHSIPCADLFLVTSDPDTNRLREQYSNDGLHLNTLGYERMGEEIFSVAGSFIIQKILR